MPIYEYSCNTCGTITEIFQTHYDFPESIGCKCGFTANKIISQVNTDLINNERWSNSMGVNPRQIPEAMKKYPGSMYNDKGQLRINNRKHKLYEIKRRGVQELE